MIVEEQQLIERLLANEPAAFGELVQIYQSAMRPVAYAIVGTNHANDVVQNAWLLVIQNLNRFEGRSSLKTWLLTITANSAKAIYRQNRRLSQRELPAPHGSIDDTNSQSDGHWGIAPSTWHEDSSEALLMESQLQSCLEHTLLRLPQLQRSMLLLRDRHGLEHEQIISLLEISANNLRILLHRSRLKLYASVEHFEKTGEC